MKVKLANHTRRMTAAVADGVANRWPTAPRFGAVRFGALILLALLFPALPSLRAQQATVVAQPVRVTVPVNFSGSTSVACAVTIATNGLSTVDANGNWVISAITLSATGVPTTPSGLSFTFTDSDTNAITQIVPTISTNDASITTNILLWVNTANVPEGVYTYSLNTGGAAADTLLLNLQVAHAWTGAGFTNSGSADFSDVANWDGGNVASPSSDVVVNDNGGVGSGDTTTNILISANTEIASFRHAINESATRRHNVQINDGVTLMITGTNGFSTGLRDNSDTYQAWQLAFTGSGGTLMVSNQDADFDTFAIENQTPLLDMSSLGTLVLDLRQIHFDDYRVYPNYDSMANNGYSDAALPRRMPVPEIRWARTNLIHLNFAGDPDNWNNPGFHQYSMIVGNDTGRGGSTQRHHFAFGISNLFEMNSVCFAGSGVAMDQTSRGSAEFNSTFSSDSPIAIFRGPNGMSDRMAMFAEADNSGEGSSGSSTKAVVDFTAGTVDALVDTLILGRDRTNASGGYARGELDIGAGTFDVNQAYLGYQNEGNNMNSGGEDFCQGALSVGNNGVFIAHDAIDLGWTTADATNNSGAAAAGYGQITVNAGGTVIANVIRVGGVTKLSGGLPSTSGGGPNAITLNGGTLIVSNTIAGPDKMLNELDMSDGTLTLFVNATNSNPYVYATNLITTGSYNTINIASLTNVSSYPDQIPLIAYGSASPNFVVTLPSGFYGLAVNNTTNKTIDLLVNTNPPASLVWSGTQDGNWNHDSLDWNTGTNTFADGDFVTFDDTATGSTTINVTEAVVPGQSPTAPGTIITNSAKDYTFSNGGGKIAGTGSMLKEGSGMLTINVESQNPLTINGGTVEGNGTIGPTILGTNATLNFTGTIGGLTSSGTVSSTGPINGPVAINAGSFVNSGTVDTTPGSMAIASDCMVTNMASGYFKVYGGNWGVGSGSVLANFGEIDNDVGRLNIDSGATLFGNGYVFDYTGDPNGNNGRLGINSGAVFGIGDAVSNSIGSVYVGARLDINQGAMAVFDVDTDNGSSDVVNVDKLSNIRGTFVLNNIGAAPFSAGQSFQLFTFNLGFNHPETAHLDYSFEPPVPGPGLQWSAGDNFISNGIVSVVAAPSSPPTVDAALSGSTLTLNWPPDHIGWQLQVQTNDLSKGFGTNWFTVPGSENYTNATVNINPAEPSVFYRLVLPPQP